MEFGEQAWEPLRCRAGVAGDGGLFLDQNSDKKRGALYEKKWVM